MEITGLVASCNVSTAIAEKVVNPPKTPVTTKCRRASMFIIFGVPATMPMHNAPMTLTKKVAQGNEVSLGI